MVSEKEENGAMQECPADRNIIFLDSTDSTNIQAKRLADEGAPHGTVVVAETQHAGKGRAGRRWESPAGCNLYFSLLLREGIVPEKASMLTLVMWLSVQEAVAVCCGVQTQIKWPNDIVLNGKKIAGILTEMHLQENAAPYVIIGTGVNIKAQDFLPELENKATFLESASKEPISREVLLAKILECFDKNLVLFGKKMDLSLLYTTYNEVLVNLGREVRVLDSAGEYTGTAEGINKEGELLVRLADGRCKQVYAGEVSVRGIYGYV